jgi:hypothetical protein
MGVQGADAVRRNRQVAAGELGSRRLREGGDQDTLWLETFGGAANLTRKVSCLACA